MKTPLQTLAGRFGLSQQQLADFLSVHRSMISHINLGTKTLPPQYLVLLQKLIALDAAKSKTAKTSIRKLVKQEIDPDTLLEIKAAITDLEIKLRMSKTQLECLREQWNHCVKAATFCVLLQEDETGLNAKQKRWLAEMQYRNEQQQVTCTPGKQLLLSLQIKALIAQLYIYNRATVIKNKINNP